MPGKNQEATPDAQPSASSVQDIAAMLLKPTKSTQPVDDVADDELDQQDVEDQDDQSPSQGSDDLTSDDQDDDQDDDIEDQEEDQTDGDDEESDTDDADEDTDEGQPQILDVSDDDLIDVTIDGKLEQRTLGELKKAIAGEGAIEKRLQEATETRKTAHAERTAILEQLADQERIVIGSLQALDDNVFVALIPAPNEALKATNAAAYLRHKEAYDKDQKRIADGKAAIQAKVNELAQQRQKRLKEYGEAAAPAIVKLIPELADPQKAPAMLDRLVVTAKAYGYTEQEISAALDPRMFHLVRDAMLYRKLQDRSKEVKVMDLSSQGKKVPRKLRSGNTKAASMVQARAKQQAQAKQTAAQTGKVKDVAAMLISPKGKPNAR